jgi:hypothetical protein
VLPARGEHAAGFAISSDRIFNFSRCKSRVKASFYNHVVVPPGDLVVHHVVLRNIPPLNKEQIIKANVAVEWGEPHPRKGTFVRKGGKEYPMQIRIVPSKDLV